MKLLVCVFLVLVILEQYHCDPCWNWLFGGGRKGNDSEKKLSVGIGFSTKTIISGGNEHKRENGHHRYPSLYRQNRLGHRPRYQPYYPPSRFPSYRTPYSTRFGRPFGATYNIRYGGASNGIPLRTPYHLGLYPTPFSMANQTLNGAPNGSPYGAHNGSPNGTPAQIPVVTGDSTSQIKHFFVTPTGIQETPAHPVDNAL